jgi:hypothetical protein
MGTIMHLANLIGALTPQHLKQQKCFDYNCEINESG